MGTGAGWWSWSNRKGESKLDIFALVGPPLLTEGLQVGKAFLLKLTDKVEVITLFGSKIAVRLGQETIGGCYYFALVTTMYLINRSKAENCVMRNFKCEMAKKVGLEREEGARIGLIGSHSLVSLDCVQEEARLVANHRRGGSDVTQAALENFRWCNRRILEGFIVGPLEVKRETVEFRCPFGGGIERTAVAANWKITFLAECVFPNAATEVPVRLGHVTVSTEIPLGANAVHFCQIEGEEAGGWERAQPISEWFA